MRLVTRGDLDGLTCGLLLQEVENIESVELVHPKDVQDGVTAITSQDILANLPYDARTGMWFDHHSSELDSEPPPPGFKGAYSMAPSAARVIADHYKSPKFARYADLPTIRIAWTLPSSRLTMCEIPRDGSCWAIRSTPAPASGGFGTTSRR